jgi:hypothetical protein
MIIEGTTEKVLKLIIPSNLIYNKKTVVSMNKKYIFEHCRKSTSFRCSTLEKVPDRPFQHSLMFVSKHYTLSGPFSKLERK